MAHAGRPKSPVNWAQHRFVYRLRLYLVEIRIFEHKMNFSAVRAKTINEVSPLSTPRGDQDRNLFLFLLALYLRQGLPNLSLKVQCTVHQLQSLGKRSYVVLGFKISYENCFEFGGP